MPVHINDDRPEVSSRVGELEARLNDALGSERLAELRVELDWIQYRSNFREPVMVRDLASGARARASELAIDLRQARRDLGAAVSRGVAELRDPERARRGRTYLEAYGPLRDSIVWRFNRSYWEHLPGWERLQGHGFEESLPGGGSDANHPEAIRDSVSELWSLLSRLDAQGDLRSEIYWLEIGVGSGRRAELWLDEFERVDATRGRRFYSRMRFLLGDYSPIAHERARARTARHSRVARIVHVDALDPLAALPELRSLVVYVHLTNVYDNLPTDQLVRRGPQLHRIEARAYVPPEGADRLRARHRGVGDLTNAVTKLLEDGPAGLGDAERGLLFWRDLWEELRLEERLVPIDRERGPDLPRGLEPQDLEAALAGAPDELRFQLSDGAVKSFVNTLPLLHPRGILHLQDLFVTDLADYGSGFRGPGKLDGSLLNWVNGALLRRVASRLGYDVRFEPFTYRPGSRTSILTATRR